MYNEYRGVSIVKKIIIVDGRKFRLKEGQKYYYNSNLRKHLHQYIWMKANGEIPEGHEIHHKDLNSFNNELSNLELLTIAEHKKLHSVVSWDDERRERARENLSKNARPKASEWHGSEKGREWHKKHFEENWDKIFQEKEFVCECCGGDFKAISNGVNRFCSNKCKSKWRRENGLDNEVRTCITCGRKFEVNKYYKTQNCSRSCTMVNRHRQNKLKDSPILRE
jgi:hypothetical protein